RALIEVVCARHRPEQLFDIAGLIGCQPKRIPSRAGHGNAAWAIRLSERTSIELHISEDTEATQASRVRRAVWISRRGEWISEKVDYGICRIRSGSRKCGRHEMCVCAVPVIEVTENALPRG